MYVQVYYEGLEEEMKKIENRSIYMYNIELTRKKRL